MNRRERRALERAGKIPKQEPKYNLTLEEIINAQTIGASTVVDKAVRQEFLKKDREFTLDMDTIYLWTLHRVFGWGYTRLKRFYLEVFKEHLRMRKFYEMDDLYPERKKLKEEVGIDLEEWYSKLFEDNGEFKSGVEDVEL